MKRTYTLSLLLLFALLSKGIAQQKVSGTITDDFKESVPGVNIIVKGTTKGTITDSEGNYELVVAKGDTLVASFIGFETQEIPINGQSVIDLTMGGVTELSEVVVLGYGSRARDELASAVSVVDHSEIEQFNSSTSIDNILQGKASGVSIVGANGRPGQTALVTVRGISTISGSIDPLYVVDGVPIDATNVNNINPADIESISVLKDAATSARYGSRAGAGVIVITTKSGETGEAQITLRSSIGLSERIDDNFQLMNAGQSLQYESELAALGLNAAASQPGGRLEPAEWGPFLNRETDWEDELLMKGQISNMSLSVNGGTKENTYYFSIARDYNEGIIESLRGFERISSRLNASFQVNDWLKTGVNISVAHSISDLPRDRANIQNPFFNMYHYKPWTTQFLTDDNGEIIPDENGDPQYNFGEGITSGFNIAEALVNNTETITHLVSVASGYLEATPIKNVNYRLTVGISNDRYQRQRFTKPGSRLDQIVGDANNPGSKNDNGNNVYQVVATNVLGYSKVFNEVHNLSADLLYEFNRRRFTDYTLTSAGFVTDRISVQDISSLPTAVGSDASERILASYGAFTNYVYDDRYIASISLRRDGSSRFGEANRWGIFWSGSVAWNVHNESCLNFVSFKSLNLISCLGINCKEYIPDFLRICCV
ncbi:MAG: SusC/RagA family TonB-linked outer membrane protein, partial [Bacteroidota bacterium]